MPDKPNARTLSDFLAWNPPLPVEILGHGLLHTGGKAIIYGKKKTYKSLLMEWLAFCCTYGVDFFSIPIPREGVSVYYLQLELNEPLLRHMRIGPMAKNFDSTAAQGAKKQFWIWSPKYLKLDTNEGRERLGKELELTNPDLLIIDPVYKVLSTTNTDREAVLRFFDNLDLLSDRYAHATLLVAHARKPPQGQTTEAYTFGDDDLSGPATFGDWADSVIKIKPTRDDRNEVILGFDVTRNSEEIVEDIKVTWDRTFKKFTDTTWHV